MTDRRVEILIGALVPPLTEQLAAQGLRLPHDDAKNYQRWMENIASLSVVGLITHRERDKAAQRLVKAIVKRVKPA